jgi:hypothetical protein
MAVEASTAPADRAVTEAGVRIAYRTAGLREPRRIVWAGGPKELARSWAEERAAGRAGENVKWPLFDQVLSRAVSQIDGRVSHQVRDAIWSGARDSPRAVTAVAVSEAVMLAVGDVRPSLMTLLRRLARRFGARRRDARASFRESGWGQHDVAWLVTYRFLNEVCGLAAETEVLRGLWMLAESAGWVVPHAEICWLAERHEVLSVDQRGRLHSAKGPALRYPDGWTLYAWKGVPLQPWMITNPGRITPEAIDRQPDPVIRRCMIEILTPARYIALGGAVRVAQDETGVLWRKHWWGPDAWAAVEVVNGTAEPDGTRKHYYLQVPPNVRSAREAVAWTYGMTEYQYANLRMRT